MAMGGKHAAGSADGREGRFQKLCRFLWWEDDEDGGTGCVATGACCC